MKKLLWLVALSLLASCGPKGVNGSATLGVRGGAPSSAERVKGPAMTHEQEVQAWADKRIAGLKKPHGWLSLVMLEWLEEGENPIPPFGVLRVNAGAVHIGDRYVRNDREEGGPDKVELGSKAFTVIKRGDRLAARMWDSEAPVRKNFHGIDRYPVTAKWRVEARWEPYLPPKKTEQATVVPGYVEEYQVPGAAVFTVEGKEYRLEPVIEETGDTELFFIFGDKTNGKETYGAGRFLYSGLPKDGKVVIDFNKAYNPPCAFTPYATCPLPSESNRIDVRVDAGEKNFGEH